MNRLRSIPIDIDDDEMAAVFHGMAIYNTGTISVAFRKEIVVAKIRLGDRIWSNIPMLVKPGERLSLDVDPFFDRIGGISGT